MFWLENTVPLAYREALRQGALIWNEAFEQAGFEGAIEVQQMPDDADWDPADVRYNTIRWSDSLGSGILGVGQSRANPLTGEILDADIVIDANVVRGFQQQYQTRGLDNFPAAEGYLQLCGQRSQAWYVQWLSMQAFGQQAFEQANLSQPQLPESHCADYLNSQHTAFGALALSAMPHLAASQLETYIQQHLVALAAHEVGHTLGLRHNFAGSLLLAPEQLNNTELTAKEGLLSSVMDYFPPNIAPPGVQQGDFFPTRVGAYDRWAIEYGYRSVTPSPLRWEEQQSLEQVAARSSLPEMGYALAYATDEDIVNEIDPEASAWDLSNDPLAFAQWQLDNAQSVWQRLNRLSVNRGEGYGSLRRRVDLVFNYFRSNTATLTTYVGGQRFRRLNPWGTIGVGLSQRPNQTPLEPIPAAKQRQALQVLNQRIFAPDAFQFSPQLLNQLPPDRWRHWGASSTSASLDYPIYERVLSVQGQALSDLLFADRLARVRDLEFKSNSEDVLTIAEVFESVYQGIWSEIAHEKPDAGPTAE
ncbi:MAG: peptidase M43, partial [Phormidesmis sp. RL_2_1]|nr:peptidase M43 [Phormidesmis sp. RL_2_1]